MGCFRVSQDNNQKASKPELITSSKPFFMEMVDSAVHRRRFSASPMTKSYLADLLEHYVISRNLFGEAEEGHNEQSKTMAERLLSATQAEATVRGELLKRLGDTSLYISGFFGDSLHRKLVDVDYYAEIGGIAYGTLAAHGESDKAIVFGDLAARFLEYVDVLTVISQTSRIQTDEDLLRLYSRYMSTGSPLAAEQLRELGVLAPDAAIKNSKQ